MAVIESKHSSSLKQPGTTTPTARHRSVKRATANRKASKPKRKKRERLPACLRPIITKRGKTTIRRYPGRSFHRFEEAQGKPIDYIELFTSGEYHAIAVYFQDKTLMHFVVDPGFSLQPEYADVKSGNWRRIKRWPLIRSANFNG